LSLLRYTEYYTYYF